MEWIYMAQGREKWLAVVNVVMKLRFPQNAENILTSLEPVSF